MQKINIVYILIVLMLFSHSSSLFAKRVENSERLNQLRLATGESTVGSTSFQARLDSMLSTSSEPTTTYAAREEAAEKALVQQQQLDENDFFFSTGLSDTRDLDQEAAEKEEAENDIFGKNKVDQLISMNKIDGTDRKYFEDKHAFDKEVEEQRNELLIEETKEDPGTLSPKEPGSLRPSLANNAFYFNNISDGEYFDARKPELIRRLVNDGYMEEAANELVLQASSQDELIIRLMEEDDYTFGEAAQLTN